MAADIALSDPFTAEADNSPTLSLADASRLLLPHWPDKNLFHNMTGSNDYDNLMNTDAPASFGYFGKYVNQPAVRQMIHVRQRLRR